MKANFSDILTQLDSDRRKGVERKLPQWAAHEGIEVPGKLALEQCSSSAAAMMKAEIIKGAKNIADLTGGLGADSWAFASAGCTVWYNEMNEQLCDAARKNFALLGVSDRISVHCSVTDTASVCALPHFDWIYLDPARRSADGRKVFKLEDCSPDVGALMPELRKHADRILIKLSPMADISVLRSSLGAGLREIRVVSVEGEVKELLCIIDSNSESNADPFAISVRSEIGMIRFTPEEEKDAVAVFADQTLAGEFLFVPGPALQKAGAFKLLSSRWPLRKLDVSTQLYTCSEPVDELLAFGKFHRIKDVLSFGKEGFSRIRELYPRAEVTARNVPISSEALSKKMGVKPGGDTHIYAVSTLSGRLLLVV